MTRKAAVGKQQIILFDAGWTFSNLPEMTEGNSGTSARKSSRSNNDNRNCDFKLELQIKIWSTLQEKLIFFKLFSLL